MVSIMTLISGYLCLISFVAARPSMTGIRTSMRIRFGLKRQHCERACRPLAADLLSGCSYKVRCEVMRHGERLGELTFFDDEETSVTQGERVRYCPGCRSDS